MKRLLLGLTLLGLASACTAPPEYDVVLRNGTLYDGSGLAPVTADLAIDGDSIVALGELGGAAGRTEIDVSGLAVAPGFVNMLSWATESLIEDGRGMSDILQGVTLEVFGEGTSPGPATPELKEILKRQQGDIRFEYEWDTLGEYLEYLVERGVSPNVASFVGATTVRTNVIGFENRPPSSEELTEMTRLVREAMEEGAVGLGSSLIYAPGFYADTDELIALARAAAGYGGMYISHLRSEGNQLLEALEELITISREAGIPAEIYHMKAAGQANWPKMEEVIARVDAARAQGLRITADMYTYTAGATGLDAAMPPWVQEGGLEEWIRRLGDPAIRTRVAQEMQSPSESWENLLLLSGSPENAILVAFKEDSLKHLTGRSLAEVAEMRGASPEEAAMDLVVADGSEVGTVYFMMSEENLAKQIRLPWMSFCSDAGAPAAEGVFLRSNPHPRAYGNFARLLGKYVREERMIPLEEAVRRLTSLPAENLGLRRRGRLEVGHHADVVVFDAGTIADHATFPEPHQYTTGMVHVFVNGEQVVRDGEHTGAKPGRVVRGPGWVGWRSQ